MDIEKATEKARAMLMAQLDAKSREAATEYRCAPELARVLICTGMLAGLEACLMIEGEELAKLGGLNPVNLGKVQNV